MSRSRLFQCLVVAAVMAGFGASTPVANAQGAGASGEVKNWGRHGVWQTSLVRRPTGGYLCMLSGVGQEPHGFGISFMEFPDHLMFMVDDRTSTAGYQPTMMVKVDDGEGETFPTFNDPPMTATATGQSQRVGVLLDRLLQARMLSVDARRARYTLSLDGFAQAADQFAACRLEAAGLGQQTTGQGQ